MTDAAQVYAQVASLITRIDQRDGAMQLWLTQPKNGGVNGDGMVTFTTIDGATFTYPCLQKLVSDMAKGDDARQDLAFFFAYNFAPSELIWSYTAVADVTYDISQSFALCKSAPASPATITILKNGAAWGTITFAAGSTTGVIAAAVPSQARGETLEFIAPATFDAAFANVSGTFAGAI